MNSQPITDLDRKRMREWLRDQDLHNGSDRYIDALIRLMRSVSADNHMGRNREAA